MCSFLVDVYIDLFLLKNEFSVPVSACFVVSRLTVLQCVLKCPCVRLYRLVGKAVTNKVKTYQTYINFLIVHQNNYLTIIELEYVMLLFVDTLYLRCQTFRGSSKTHREGLQHFFLKIHPTITL